MGIISAVLLMQQEADGRPEDWVCQHVPLLTAKALEWTGP